MKLLNTKEKLITIYESALKNTSPGRIVRESILLKKDLLFANNRSFHFEKIFVIGFGKAACSMAGGIEEVIPHHLIEGIVVTKYGHTAPLSKILAFEAGHPVPDENSLIAADEIIRCLNRASKNDLVIFLISGGGSALLEKPRPGISLSDIKIITDLLLRSGATINEMNVIRKHLSVVKGGGLARMAHPASFISLILSDVIGSDISSIASGPTVGDPSTFHDCWRIIEKYNLPMKIPQTVKNLFLIGTLGQIEDTPSPEDPLFASGLNLILLDNEIFCKEILLCAEREGLKTHYIKTHLTTAAAEEMISGLTGVIEPYYKSAARPALLISGGEVTLNIPEGKTGKGGRNQHLALLFTRHILPVYPDIFALFASTDGTDGPTDGSGGFSHRSLLEKLKDGSELESAIRNYDSYNFLKKYDELFVTGPTGNNLNDVFLIYLP